MRWLFGILALGFVAIVILVITVSIVMPGAPHELFSPTDVRIAEKNLHLLLADDPAEYTQGLSDRNLADLPADGMWFVFSTFEERTFWMHNMKFNLDVLWLAHGRIVKIDTNIPAPQDGEDPATMSSDPYEVDMVIELPAGKANEFGLKVGDLMEFEN